MTTPVLCIIGIDGVRLDVAREPGAVPTLQRFFNEGSFTQLEMEVPTISGPGWSSLLTGSTHAEHGVFDNTFHGHRLQAYPDVLSQIYYRNNQAKTYAASGWPPLTDPFGPAPVIAARPDQQAAGLHRVLVRDGETYGYRRADGEITAFSVMALGYVSPTASFIYLGEVDEAGHMYGVGSEYREALKRVDEHLARIVHTIERVAIERDEDWLVAVMTDHGHVDEGGHGGADPLETTSFLTTRRISAGGETTEPLPQLRPEEVAAHLMRHVVAS